MTSRSKMATVAVLSFLIALTWPLVTHAGYASYSSATHLCCNGTVVARSAHVECCGGAAFDTREYVCCDGRSLHPLPAGRNDSTYDCCFGSSGSASLYDFTTEQCCDGQVLEKPDREALFVCCHRRLFSPVSQLCCGGLVVARQADEDCCDAEVFNPRNQTCCEQWEAVDGKLVRTSVAVFSHQGGATQCCGTGGLHDPSVSICCQGTVRSLPASAPSSDSVDCCQGAPYDVALETCCETFAMHDGKWVEAHRIQPVADGLCCGLDVYDFRSEVCCGETVHARAPGAVCCGERLLADSAAEVCLGGAVVPRNGSDVQRCGGRVYYADTHTCCNGRVVALESEVEECCWEAKRTYRKEREMCCGAEVVPIDDLGGSSGNDSCCAPEVLM